MNVIQQLLTKLKIKKYTHLKKAFIILPIVLVIVGCGFTVIKLYTKPPKDYYNLANWITFNDPQDHFSVLLPDKPKISTNSGTLTDTIPNGPTYSVKITVLTSLTDQVYSLLSEASSSGKANLVYADEHTDASGIPFLDYKILQTSGKTPSTIKGRMFLIENKIFILKDTLPKGQNDDTLFNHFLSSFTLTQ